MEDTRTYDMDHPHETGHPVELDNAEAAAKRRELFSAIDRFLVEFYGERCNEVQGGCATCAAWAARDVLNATVFEE